MKNYFDSFYEIMHKNSVKRRRMISLLLVLSIFVSSGVLWELRDTVITMVNEPVCGLEEHEHTDECYEKVLVCGLEENEEHTHTEECYENVLVCGHDEHCHTTLCYTDEDIPEGDTVEEDEFDDTAYAISNVLEDDAELGNELLAMDFPKVMLDNGVRMMADESTLPPTVSTIDNIAEGIRFTLFDYGDSALESELNHYGFEPTENTSGYWSHPNANTTDGINTGRNINDDILFFAYGTPVPGDIPKSNDYEYYNYWTGENNTGTHMYNPDKNSYSGDYNSIPKYTGNRPVQGIVKNQLENGYPVMNNNKANSLDYLFNDSTAAYKTVYTDVNHFLQNINGHLVYNSNNNYAYFNTDTKEFDVYNKTYDIINDAHHEGGQTNPNKFNEDGTPYVYPLDDTVDPGFKIGFFPFDQYDETRKDPNYNGNGFNHHFGMKMEADFSNYTDINDQSAKPIVFKYSGDDDMWVFVDDVLVLDIGGIHEPAAGMIDFTNGLVWTQDNALGDTAESAYNTLSNTNTNLPEVSKILLPDNGVNTDGTSESKWKVETLASKFAGIEGKSCGPNDNKDHTIKMFYLERGGCYSNLAMEMNLPTLKPLTVMKTVDYQQHLVKDPEIDNKSYEFQVYEWDNNNNIWVITQDSDSEASFYLPENHFFLKDGDRKTFKNLGQERKFKVVEVGVDPNIFDQVKVTTVKGTTTQSVSGSAAVNVGSGEEPYPLSDVNSYTFNNRVIEDDTTNLKVVKDWEPYGNIPTKFTMKYRIMRTDSATGEVKQIALQYIDEEDGNKIKKRRVFALDADHYESGNTHEGLLARYGNHIYSYRVEELNVPRGYNASYKEGTESVTVDGVTKTYKLLKVTNTDVSNVDIYVKKQWLNVPETTPDVKLVLKREKVGFSDSTPTSLTVNILDEGGNPIKSNTFTNVYANGSAEIYYQLPEGVVLYRGDSAYPKKRFGSNSEVALKVLTCTNTDNSHTHTDTCYQDNNTVNGKLYVKFEEDENILVVQNLEAKVNPNNPDEIANEVTFKVTSDNAEDSLLLLHHSFTRGANGWVTNTLSPTFFATQNGATVENQKVTSSGVTPYAKGDGLIVQGRENAWNGAKLVLDPAKFKANKTYTFSVYILSPEDDDYKMTFNNGLGDNEPLKLLGSNAQSLHISSEDGWTQLTGTIKLTDKIDPYNMYLLIETLPVDNDYKASVLRGGTFFRMDEFTAIEGTLPVSVSPQIMDGNTMTDPGGVVTIGEAVHNVYVDGNYIYDYTNMQNYPSKGWNNFGLPKGNDNLSLKNGGNGNYAVVVQGRKESWQGVSKQLETNMQHNKTYHLFSQVAGYHTDNDKTTPHTIIVALKYNIDGNNAVYRDITSIDTSGNEWGTINHYFSIDDTSIFDVAVDTSKPMEIYYHTSNETDSFEVWSSRLSEATQTTSQGFTEPKSGYTINEYGQYVSDYSNYGLTLDVNSVTNPLRLNGDYTTDNWSKEITLPYNGTMVYHWDKDELEEVHNGTEDYLYRYWVEEVKIGGGDVSSTIVTVDGNKAVRSTYDNYTIAYDRQFVSTNTSDTPILVTNNYIWYSLPATGGSGTGRIYFLGFVLTVTGIISGSALYRRKRRRE